MPACFSVAVNVGCLVVVFVVKLFPLRSFGVLGELQLVVVADASQVGLLRDSSFGVLLYLLIICVF